MIRPPVMMRGDGQRQARELRQHGVAEDVADRVALLHAQATVVVHVIRAELVDGHGPHANRLASDEDQDERPER